MASSSPTPPTKPLTYIIEYHDDFSSCVLGGADTVEQARELVVTLKKWDEDNCDPSSSEEEEESSTEESGGDEEEEGEESISVMSGVTSEEEEEEGEDDDSSEWTDDEDDDDDDEEVFDPKYPFWEEDGNYVIVGIEIGQFYGWHNTTLKKEEEEDSSKVE